MNRIDPNRTTPADMARIAKAVHALHAANGVCPLSMRIAGSPFQTFGDIRSVRRTKPDANLVLTETVAVLPEYALEVTVSATEYLDFPVYEYLVTIRNLSCSKSPLITDLYAADVILPGKEPVLYRCTGDFYSEKGYHTTSAPLTAETEQIAPTEGRSCNEAFPYFRVACEGFGYNLAIGWPGRWLAEFSQRGEGFRFAAKQYDTAFSLLPGEVYRAPRITVMAYEGDTQRGMNVWRRWYMQHILPRSAGQPVQPMMPIYHPAGDEEFTHTTEENQLEAIETYAKRGFRGDIWWIDAGWYPCRDEKGERHWPLVGNWIPDPERFPNGFGPVGEACARHGLRFLVWFEPERVILDHRPPEMPERFVLKRRVERDGKSWIDAQGLLNLGDPECRKWLTNHVNRLIQEGHIAIYRQDFNFDPLPYWQQADAPDRIGMTENQHIQGYLAYWDALLEANPGLIIDSCASGGRRNDLETMRRSVTMHPTDYGYGDPPIKQRFYNALFAWIPYFRALSVIWKEENGKYLLNEPDPRGLDNYALHNGLGPMFNSGVFCDDPQELLDRVRTFADTVWHPAAPYMMEGDYYPLTETRCSVHDWCAYAFFDPKKESGFIHLIRNPYAEAETFTTHLSPLDPACTYRFTNPETGEQFDTAGNAALTFALPARSGTIWFFAPKK